MGGVGGGGTNPNLVLRRGSTLILISPPLVYPYIHPRVVCLFSSPGHLQDEEGAVPVTQPVCSRGHAGAGTDVVSVCRHHAPRHCEHKAAHRECRYSTS